MSGYGVAKTYGASHSQAMSIAVNGARSGAISGAMTYGVNYGMDEIQTAKEGFASKMFLRATMGGLKAGLLGQNVEQGMMMGVTTEAGIVGWDYAMDGDPGIISNWYNGKNGGTTYIRDYIVEPNWDRRDFYGNAYDSLQYNNQL